jgi:Effector Associated Constant Component 1
MERWVMVDSGGLILGVDSETDDAGELAELTGWLREELLHLDVAAVEPVPGVEVLPGEKGVASVFGCLAVQLGPESLRTVLVKVADWATRNNRGVEVTVGNDTLKLTQATREQQERIIDAWLAQHQAGI